VPAATTPIEFLRTPVTEPGRTLLDLIEARLPDIAATAAANDRHSTFPFDVFSSFMASGVMGATVPAELGGLGVTRLHDVATALLAVATADASTALALHMQFSRGLTLSYEWRHGAPQARDLAEKLLRRMAEGKAAVCGAVKDHPAAATELSPDGAGGWVLAGRKTLVSMAPIGTHFVVHAWTRAGSGAPVLAAAMVPRETPGVSVLDTWRGLGMRASGTFDIAFDQCPLPAENVLIRDTVGKRDDSVLAGQTVSSITMLGIYVGIAQAARDATIESIVERPSAPPAAVRTLAVEIDASLYALRAAAGAALANADAYSADLSGDPSERGRRMMVPFQHAKLVVNRLARTIVDDCMTTTGSRSYSIDHVLSRLYRDVRAGEFMQPFTYVDGTEFLSSQLFGLGRDNNYMSVRARTAAERVVG
jgi:alkylation response protein AidB-like acyl-CoA dehydrogenase